MRIASVVALCLVAACTAHAQSNAQSSAAPTATASVASGTASGGVYWSDTLTCTDGGARVELDRKTWTATYFQDGALVGSSKCGGTRMAVYNMTCTEDARFRFLFASVPGPAILGGKSARLDSNGKTVLLDCRPISR